MINFLKNELEDLVNLDHKERPKASSFLDQRKEARPQSLSSGRQRHTQPQGLIRKITGRSARARTRR